MPLASLASFHFTRVLGVHQNTSAHVGSCQPGRMRACKQDGSALCHHVQIVDVVLFAVRLEALTTAASIGDRSHAGKCEAEHLGTHVLHVWTRRTSFETSRGGIFEAADDGHAPLLAGARVSRVLAGLVRVSSRAVTLPERPWRLLLWAPGKAAHEDVVEANVPSSYGQG